MYALDIISFSGFCWSYEEIHRGWSQSHYVDFIVKHHVNHFRFQSLFYSIYALFFKVWGNLSMYMYVVCLKLAHNIRFRDSVTGFKQLTFPGLIHNIYHVLC